MGGKNRIRLLVLTAVPVLFLADFNGGVTSLGFEGSTMQEDFKARPDYVTNTIFMAHRQTVPEVKYF